MPSLPNWNGTIDEKQGEWAPSGALLTLHGISTAVAEPWSLMAVVLQSQPGASCWKCRRFEVKTESEGARNNPAALRKTILKK